MGMTHIDVSAVSDVLLEDVASILSEKDLEYQRQHPEAGVVVYHLIFHFIIMHYVKGRGAVWDTVDVEMTTTQIDVWQAYLEAEMYVIETYEPIEIHFLGVDVVGAYVVNVPHQTINWLPEKYWYDWKGALEREISEVDVSEL
ncbi:hypothetical protein [Thermofilum sp.]|uniref:hypothetical protein n=1 Tax=Thermofilum sp. TaxID=1961369 RepID=UPI00317AF052